MAYYSLKNKKALNSCYFLLWPKFHQLFLPIKYFKISSCVIPQISDKSIVQEYVLLTLADISWQFLKAKHSVHWVINPSPHAPSPSLKNTPTLLFTQPTLNLQIVQAPPLFRQSSLYVDFCEPPSPSIKKYGFFSVPAKY